MFRIACLEVTWNILIQGIILIEFLPEKGLGYSHTGFVINWQFYQPLLVFYERSADKNIPSQISMK